MGAVTGHLPVPLPAFSSLSSPLLFLHQQVTELSSGEERMKRLRENYTESFSLTRREVESRNFKQLLKRQGQGSERKAGQEKDRQMQREKKTEKAIWDLRS